MDKFYTSDRGLQIVHKIIQENNLFQDIDLFVDFSAGDGRFTKLLDIKSECYDIDPANEDVVRQDWFRVTTLKNVYSKLAVGLNPPFGYRSQEAKKFVKHAIQQFQPKVIVLIVPRSFTYEKDGYTHVMEVNLEEDIFFLPESQKTFCFPTKFVALKKGQKKAEESSEQVERNFSIRVAGTIKSCTQLLVRRAGVYSNEQFYCIDGPKVEFMDRGNWSNTDWIKNNHSVQEGGDVSKVHGSSNPKRGSGKQKSESTTGWSWYKVDFKEKQSMIQLKKLVKHIYDNQPASKTERSRDINILAKSSPPSINTKYLYPVIDSFYK